MSNNDIQSRLESIIEKLASCEHERWAHWQNYLHSQGKIQEDGGLLLPAELVQRWERQLGTAYADLSAQEKQSDRDQVLRYLPLIYQALTQDERGGTG